MSDARRIMVDMSATLLHHGHIRLIQRAREHGEVIIGLTSDAEIMARKGYWPELDFQQRREILLAVDGVAEVVETPWLLDEAVLDEHRIDLLVHGDDNSNPVRPERLLVLPRTEDISSSELRQRARASLNSIANRRLLLTPGPAAMPVQNLQRLGPVFGRGDREYEALEQRVLDWLLTLSGQQEIIRLQGSATLGLEIALRNFVGGRVLLVDSGYYSERLLSLLNPGLQVERVSVEQLDQLRQPCDWVLACYVETSCAMRLDLEQLRAAADRLGARLFLDATASIGLEPRHELADAMAFSSCKGLFGLTGAAFVAWKADLETSDAALPWYFDLAMHQRRGVTGPYHAMCSLDAVRPNYDTLLQRVRRSKERALQLWPELVGPAQQQPLLCTHLLAQVSARDEDVVLYTPRSDNPGSIICHMGELHRDEVLFDQRIEVTPL